MAVATTLVQAITTDWTDCGAGPFLNVSSNGRDVFSIADTKPAFPSIGFHIQPELQWVSATTSHLWVTGVGVVAVSK